MLEFWVISTYDGIGSNGSEERSQIYSSLALHCTYTLFTLALHSDCSSRDAGIGRCYRVLH
eukprot:scaffold7056_cov144-Skeletonema_marinoi.AAC.3